MPMLTDIADAVTAKINAASIAPGLAAERILLPVFELKDMKKLKVSVVPKARKIVQGTRTENINEIQIDIGVQKKISNDDELDGLMKIVEDIAGLFKAERLDGYKKAICVKVENEPVYDHEHLRQLRQFTSVITLAFKVL